MPFKIIYKYSESRDEKNALMVGNLSGRHNPNETRFL